MLASGALSAEDLDALLTTESLTRVGGLGDVLPGDPILVAESMVCGGREP